MGCTFLLMVAPTLAAKTVLRSLDDQSFAALSERHGAYLDVRVNSADELVPAIRIYSGHLTDDLSLTRLGVVKVNAQRAFIPFHQLSPPFRRSFVQKLWPKDRADEQGNWVHYVRHAGHETLWSLSFWFTGSGKHHRAISRASNLRGSTIRKGTRLIIPHHLLIKGLQSLVIEDVFKPDDPFRASQTQILGGEEIEEADPRPLATPPTGETSAPENTTPAPDPERNLTTQQALQDSMPLRRLLSYGEDSKGPYGEYRLRRGEAIYSAVVVRFCGLVSGEDVNRVAGIIIERNGIQDETDLPVNHPIRIPYNYLEPEFRKETDPEFQAYVQNLRTIGEVSTDVEALNLKGVVVVLDSGHGGRDTGAKFGHVWEDDFVYDIMCRIKQTLERETQATVLTTTLDPSVEYKVQDVSRFTLDQDEVLLCNPRYHLNNRRVATDGVNLRWIIANHHFDRLTRAGIKPENMVFASLHADSLHPSIRGAMVYTPHAQHAPSSVGPPHTKFRQFKEYSGNQFTVSAHEKASAQAFSMKFGQLFVNHARAMGLQVHPHKPIRTVIFRKARSQPFVPAVIRYNRIPRRCLIEVCNLNNAEDRKLLALASFRQKAADAFVMALYETYGVNIDMVARNESGASTQP